MDPVWGFFFKKKETEENKNLRVLSNSPVFHGLRNTDLKHVVKLVHQRVFQKGDVIFTGGDPGVGMYIVSEGLVGVYVINPETEAEEKVADFTPGQTFGDIALFSDAPRTATVRATHKTTLLGFCKPDLMTLIHRNPKLGSVILMSLLGLAGKRLYYTNEQLVQSKRELQIAKEKIESLGDSSDKTDLRV